METCGAVADFDRVDGKLTSGRPPRRRTPPHLYAIVAGLPEHKIRVISPDIGGGFGNKVPIYPGYVCAIVGSIVTGKPVKWMEDRIGEPDQHRLRPRLHMRGEIAPPGRQDPRVRTTCSPTTARSTARRSRRSTRPASSASSPAATTSRPRTAR
jgi:CO/xanthine dehydrogenase Mo-binding subunit